MAQVQQTVLIDDVDGGDAVETITFALDGVAYEIDLNEENAASLREALSTWVGHARKVSGRSPSGGRGTRGRARNGGGSGGASGGGAGDDTAAVRAWARETGHTVNDRGRVSGAVLEAYRAAHA